MSALSRARLSVIVSTYDWPEALDVVLRGLSEQEGGAFEVVVAEDGAGPETADVVDRWRAARAFPIEHVWQPKAGWRKARVLNLAGLSAEGGYLLFLDGDAIPRRGFLRAIRRCILPGWFLASKRLHLSQEFSRRVLEERLPVWRWSAAHWLAHTPRELLTSHREARSPGALLPLRDRRRPWRGGQPEFSPPYEGYGFCFGFSRADFERANGFDMRFVGWGGEDEDLAARLRRMGLRCGWPGPRATMLHLWHPAKKGTMPSNAPLVRETKTSGRIEAVEGLRELAAELEGQVSANRVGSSSPVSEPEKR